MFEIMKSGGLMMLPIILCSIGAMGIIVECFWALQNFIINADGKRPHQVVTTALEAAGDTGFSHITFAAQHPRTKP